jgi:hypothetical protein
VPPRCAGPAGRRDVAASGPITARCSKRSRGSAAVTAVHYRAALTVARILRRPDPDPRDSSRPPPSRSPRRTVETGMSALGRARCGPRSSGVGRTRGRALRDHGWRLRALGGRGRLGRLGWSAGAGRPGSGDGSWAGRRGRLGWSAWVGRLEPGGWGPAARAGLVGVVGRAGRLGSGGRDRAARAGLVGWAGRLGSGGGSWAGRLGLGGWVRRRRGLGWAAGSGLTRLWGQASRVRSTESTSSA